MSSPNCIAFAYKYVAGWPKNLEVDARAAVVAPASAVLTYRFPYDAHFVAYTADVPRRLTGCLLHPVNEARVTEANPRMVLAVFDVDAPDHVSSDFWWAEETVKIASLTSAHPGAFTYRTRGGYRVVFRLPKPLEMRTQTDVNRWTASYQSWCKYLARRFEIQADTACADWTRFYRAPHATRDGVPQKLETIGDPNELGAWSPVLEQADRVRAKPVRSAPIYGAVEPVQISDTKNEYGQARLVAAVRYLQQAPLSIQGEKGRDTFFSICCYLVRRLRLPLDVAADCIEEVYNPLLRAVGTEEWDRHEIENRLESASSTASRVEPGEVWTEAFWLEINSPVRVTA